MHSPMYNKLRDLYLAGKLNDAALDSAVVKGWLTPEEVDEIRADKLNQDAEAEIINQLIIDELSG